MKCFIPDGSNAENHVYDVKVPMTNQNAAIITGAMFVLVPACVALFMKLIKPKIAVDASFDTTADTETAAVDL